MINLFPTLITRIYIHLIPISHACQQWQHSCIYKYTYAHVNHDLPPFLHFKFPNAYSGFTSLKRIVCMFQVEHEISRPLLTFSNITFPTLIRFTWFLLSRRLDTYGYLIVKFWNIKSTLQFMASIWISPCLCTIVVHIWRFQTYIF